MNAIEKQVYAVLFYKKEKWLSSNRQKPLQKFQISTQSWF
jgi:hypothetical protein